METMNHEDSSQNNRKIESNKVSRPKLQRAILKLGELGLSNTSLDIIIAEAISRIRFILNVPFCSVFQLSPNGGLVLNWGDGWKTGFIGRELNLGKSSQEASTLRSEEPIAVEDYRLDERFVID